MSQSIKFLTKNNLIILLGGIVLALGLLLATRTLPSCPLRQTANLSFPANCPLFVDQNLDGVCDLIQEAAFPPSTEFDFSFFKEFVIFALLFAIAILINFKKPKNLPTFRFALCALSLIYFGFLLHQSLCPIATLQMVFVQKERVVLPIFIFLFFLLPILATLLFGRIFCHFLCPVGATQELIFRISKKIGKFPTLIHFPRLLFYLPFLILILVAFFSFFLSTAIFCRLDPFGFLFSCNRTEWKIAPLVILLFSFVFIFRPFCQFLCPLGAIFRILEKFRILKPKASFQTKTKDQ